MLKPDVKKSYDNHVMTCHEHAMNTCHEGINTPITCHDSNQKESQNGRLTKEEWWYLVNTLESWRVYNPRAVVKKNPAAAWKIMNICKDNNVRVPGAYFTRCFKNELFKLEIKKELKHAINC